ncbi:MAG: helix-hairpin-helix domain-containing protein [Acidobacteriaceae bacterium]
MKTVSASWRWADIAAVCVFGTLAFALLGCTNGRPNDQEIRQKSEQATRDARQGAKQLAANAKVAAANAVEGVNAAAQGIRDGVKNGKADDTSDKVDINSASTARLALLPGISITKAHDIVQGRPYRGAHSLVRRGLLTQDQYDRIADKITAR